MHVIQGNLNWEKLPYKHSVLHMVEFIACRLFKTEHQVIQNPSYSEEDIAGQIQTEMSTTSGCEIACYSQQVLEVM